MASEPTPTLAAAADETAANALREAHALHQHGDHAGAATLLRALLLQQPQQIDALCNLAICHQHLGQHAEVLALAERVLALRPELPLALDLLTKALHRLGREAEATSAGTRALLAKDRACPAAPAGWAPPAGTPQAFANMPGKRPVIAFSLWGTQPRHLRGALRNALLTPDLFPAWTLRFYLDETVPAAFVAALHSLQVETCLMPAGQSLRQRLCWRFGVANDAGVGRFLVRDADSVFSVREVAAVQAWCESGRWFHVIRDWWTHTELMQAGLWGGVAGVLPPLAPLLASYAPSANDPPNIDQRFLRDRVWPLLRDHCLAHDRCFTPPGSVALPPAPGNFHIGQDEFSAHPRRQQALLQAWIRQLPCLALP